MGRCAGQNGGEAGAHTFSGKNAGVKAFFFTKKMTGQRSLLSLMLFCSAAHFTMLYA